MDDIGRRCSYDQKSFNDFLKTIRGIAGEHEAHCGKYFAAIPCIRTLWAELQRLATGKQLRRLFGIPNIENINTLAVRRPGDTSFVSIDKFLEEEYVGIKAKMCAQYKSVWLPKNFEPRGNEYIRVREKIFNKIKPPANEADYYAKHFESKDFLQELRFYTQDMNYFVSVDCAVVPMLFDTLVNQLAASSKDYLSSLNCQLENVRSSSDAKAERLRAAQTLSHVIQSCMPANAKEQAEIETFGGSCAQLGFGIGDGLWTSSGLRDLKMQASSRESLRGAVGENLLDDRRDIAALMEKCKKILKKGGTGTLGHQCQ
jgi:hypothetical protein